MIDNSYNFSLTKGRQFIPTAAKFEHVFSKNMKRNRVELVSDFPNDAEVISSLQIHPHGWCALSRNISYDESTEFTCLHDIQHRDYDTTTDNLDADNEVSDQRKTLDATNDTHVNEVAVVNTSRSVTPQTSANSDSQALNLTTSSPTSVSISDTHRFSYSFILIIELFVTGCNTSRYMGSRNDCS